MINNIVLFIDDDCEIEYVVIIHIIYDCNILLNDKIYFCNILDLVVIELGIILWYWRKSNMGIVIIIWGIKKES
jgi:hypothetical protein